VVGLALIRAIRALPGFAELPIVALSASASQSDVDKTLRAGANAFLPKPVDFSRLQTELASLLALEWIYEGDGQDSPLTPERVAQLRLPAPPAVPMRELHRLARMGDMRGVRRWAEEAAAWDTDYAAFCSALQALARTYQSKALLAFVERHLNEGSLA
jgi:response regulator RpfG family c-di-GMP phosphodiesterase